MCGHVASVNHTGTWDRAQCLADWYTGEPDCVASKEADDCWSEAPHQWYNQGCAISDERNYTIGQTFNDQGGRVYLLEWDDYNRHIRLWVFAPHESIPDSLAEGMRTASGEHENENDVGSANRTYLNPDEWGTPFAYYTIGAESACPTHHFQTMRIIFNLAFCGMAAGNRYFGGCPKRITRKFNVTGGDPVLSCNAYIESNPEEMDEAFWKIRGVYVYERQWQ